MIDHYDMGGLPCTPSAAQGVEGIIALLKRQYRPAPALTPERGDLYPWVYLLSCGRLVSS